MSITPALPAAAVVHLASSAGYDVRQRVQGSVDAPRAEGQEDQLGALAQAWCST